MAKGKKYADATKRFDREQLHTRRRGASTSSRAWPRPSSTRPSSWRSASASIPARPTRWCAAPSRCPSGTGKDVRVAVFAAGDAADGRPRGRRRHRRRRRPRRRGRGRHARLRRRHRHAGPHAAGRPARPGARPPWPDAEPQDRHRHHRRRRGRQRVQGRQGRVPHRPLRQRARADRQGQLRARSTCWPTSGPCSTSSSGPSRPRPRAATSRRITVSSTMGPGVKVDPGRLRPADDDTDRRAPSAASISA